MGNAATTKMASQPSTPRAGSPGIRAAAPFVETTRHHCTSPYSPTSRLADALENRVVPVRARSVEPQMRPQRFWPKQAATLALLPGLATRKPLLLFSFAGLLALRDDEDKLLELLFQLPPRTTRAEEPTIPIPLPPVSGSAPLDEVPHCARVLHEHPTL